ncbi:MAG: PilZ domain-containing protein [Desulfobacterales bacterium]|nr:MAG: PilZ domain-containing protein [Desulfobacterales bacterium]
MTREDKRKHPRIDSLNLLYVCLDENENIAKQGMGRTLNVSETGILLETHFPIAPEHTVILSIGLKEDLIDVKGKPVHFRSAENQKYAVGIQFLEPDKKAIRIIRKFIQAFNHAKKLSGQPGE